MEPGNLETWKAGTSERRSPHTPLSDKYPIIQQEPLSPLPKQLSPLLGIHQPLLFIYSAVREESFSLRFS